MSEDPPKSSEPSRSVKVLTVFGYAAFGLISGALIGLVAIPVIGSWILPDDYEIKAWDGQAIGEVVGLLAGIWLGIRPYVIRGQYKTELES